MKVSILWSTDPKTGALVDHPKAFANANHAKQSIKLLGHDWGDLLIGSNKSRYEYYNAGHKVWWLNNFEPVRTA